MNFIDTFKIWF